MDEDNELTAEHKLLEANPGLRADIQARPEFQQWRDNLPQYEDVGILFRIIRGDQGVDDDQVIVEWARIFHPELLGGPYGKAPGI